MLFTHECPGELGVAGLDGFTCPLAPAAVARACCPVVPADGFGLDVDVDGFLHPEHVHDEFPRRAQPPTEAT